MKPNSTTSTIPVVLVVTQELFEDENCLKLLDYFYSHNSNNHFRFYAFYYRLEQTKLAEIELKQRDYENLGVEKARQQHTHAQPQQQETKRRSELIFKKLHELKPDECFVRDFQKTLDVQLKTPDFQNFREVVLNGNKPKGICCLTFVDFVDVVFAC